MRCLLGSAAGMLAVLTAWPPRLRAEDTVRGAIETLLALAEVVVDDRPLSVEARRDLAAHLARSANEDPAQRVRHESTARLLDRLAGTRFATLDLPTRREIVERHRLHRRALAADEPDRDTDEVRGIIVPDLIRAFWSSPAGWAVVGYAAFPGRCGDLARYTGAEPG